MYTIACSSPIFNHPFASYKENHWMRYTYQYDDIIKKIYFINKYSIT